MEINLQFLPFLARATLLVTFGGIILEAILRLLRVHSYRTQRIGSVLVLALGWLAVGIPLSVPFSYSPPIRTGGHSDSTAVSAGGERKSTNEPSEFSETKIFLEPKINRIERPVETASELNRLPILRSGEHEKFQALSAPIGSGGFGTKHFRWNLWGTEREFVAVVIAVYFGGMFGMIVCWVIRYRRFLRAASVAETPPPNWLRLWEELLAEENIPPEKIPMRITDGIGPALAWGPFRSTLYLPHWYWELLDEAAHDPILRHERAHYLRRDGFASLMIRLMALAQWFNPVAWRLVRRFDEAAEWACDESAIDGHLPRLGSFAEALMLYSESVSGRRNLMMPSGLADEKSSRRIERLAILAKTPHPKETIMKKILLSLLFGLLLLVGLVRIRLVAVEEKIAETSSAPPMAASVPNGTGVPALSPIGAPVHPLENAHVSPHPVVTKFYPCSNRVAEKIINMIKAKTDPAFGLVPPCLATEKGVILTMPSRKQTMIDILIHNMKNMESIHDNIWEPFPDAGITLMGKREQRLHFADVPDIPRVMKSYPCSIEAGQMLVQIAGDITPPVHGGFITGEGQIEIIATPSQHELLAQMVDALEKVVKLQEESQDTPAPITHPAHEEVKTSQVRVPMEYQIPFSTQAVQTILEDAGFDANVIESQRGGFEICATLPTHRKIGPFLKQLGDEMAAVQSELGLKAILPSSSDLLPIEVKIFTLPEELPHQVVFQVLTQLSSQNMGIGDISFVLLNGTDRLFVQATPERMEQVEEVFDKITNALNQVQPIQKSPATPDAVFVAAPDEATNRVTNTEQPTPPENQVDGEKQIVMANFYMPDSCSLGDGICLLFELMPQFPESAFSFDRDSKQLRVATNNKNMGAVKEAIQNFYNKFTDK